MQALPQWTDDNLVLVFGDPGFDEQTAELMRRFKEDVDRSIERRIPGNPQAVEDVAADVWERVLRGKNTFIPGTDGKPAARKWICCVADRAAIDWLRRRAGSHLVTGVPDGGGDRAAPAPAVLERLAMREEVVLLHQAVARLPIEDQVILLLVRPGPTAGAVGLGQMTLRQTADLIGCSLGGVNHRVKAVVNRLRELLNDRPG